MKKAFAFIEGLTPLFYELMGFPTIKVYSEITEVYFDCTSVIRDLEIFEFNGYDELRFFAGDNCITFVYTFYDKKD